jgi:PAS domain S-box-containing protein
MNLGMPGKKLDKEREKMVSKVSKKKISAGGSAGAGKDPLKIEESYRRLVELSPDMMALHSNGKYLYMNPAGLKILRASSQEEILGKPVSEIIHPESREMVKSRIRQLENGKDVPPIEEKFLRLDGTIVDVEVTAAPIPSNGKPMIQVLARDITQRKQTEKALKRSIHASQRLAFEQMIMAEIGRIVSSTLDIKEVYKFFAEKVKTLIPYDRLVMNLVNHDGITLVNQYVEGGSAPGRDAGESFPLAGTLTEKMIKIRKGILFNGKDEQEVEEKFPGLMPETKAGARSFLSVPFISRDQVIGGLHFRSNTYGAYSDKDLRLAESIASQIAGAIANARLFAERQQVEKALKDSEEKYRLLVQNAKDAIFIVQDGVIKFSNGKTEKLFGYSGAELAEVPFVNHIHPADRETAYGSIPGGSVGKEFPKAQSFRIKNQAGQEIWLELKSADMEWEGKPASLNFASDITEQKKLEAQFFQAQKMEAVGRLAGGVAHDFNNLLTVINSNSQLALMELREWDPLKEKIESIQKAGEKAANLTRQLLSFSRRQVVEMKVIDLNATLQDLEKMLRRVIGEDIELSFLLDKNLGRLKADPGQIEQAILNLIVNARDAMPSGGKIVVETCNVNLDQEYTLTHMGMKPGPHVMLSISDTGMGMKPEIRERIFEPFFTTKEKGKGTGLGLSTVYGAVKQSGGNVWVYSEPRQGTTFKIYLPRVDEPLEAPAKKLTRGKMPHGHETILVVEDEEEVRKLAVGILGRYGYRVLEASHGGEALQICEQCKEPIHLLMSDVVMPGMSGPDFARRLKYFYPEIKVLFMSGYTDNALSQNGLLDEAVFFLQKPFSVEKLTGKIREVLDQ